MRRTTADVGLHFARHYPGRTMGEGQEDQRQTLRELAADYGVTPARMRTALRMSREYLRRKGLVCSVPVRDDGFVIVVTNEEAEVAYRIVHRLMPITTEVIRHAEDYATVSNGAQPFNSLIEALFEAQEFLAEVTENTV